MATTQKQTAMTPQNTQGNEIAKVEMTMSERFTNTVLKEFGSNVAGALQVTDYQRQLIQGILHSHRQGAQDCRRRPDQEERKQQGPQMGQRPAHQLEHGEP